MPNRFRTGVKKSRPGGGEGQFFQRTIISPLPWHQEKETPGKRLILLSKGTVEHFNVGYVYDILWGRDGSVGANQASSGEEE